MTRGKPGHTGVGPNVNSEAEQWSDILLYEIKSWCGEKIVWDAVFCISHLFSFICRLNTWKRDTAICHLLCQALLLMLVVSSWTQEECGLWFLLYKNLAWSEIQVSICFLLLSLCYTRGHKVQLDMNVAIGVEILLLPITWGIHLTYFED
jgi:cell division protein FtsW (lipid II flippase)